MLNITKISNLNYIIAVPLVVMSYHIFHFYETEPWPIRLGLAISFDLMVVLVFYLLKDEYINRVKRARQVTWATLMVLIGFQLYVNIWAYWELSLFRALVSGGIFPLTVGLITYIGMVREQQAEMDRAQENKKKKALNSLAKAETPEEITKIASERPYRDKRVDKADVITAYERNPAIDETRELFLGSTNMKSVDRWLNKLDNGKTP